MSASADENSAPPLPAKVLADDKIKIYRDNLLGECGGRRNTMLAQGYDLQINYKLDLLSNTTSSRDEMFGLDNLDIKLNIDFEKINGRTGSTAFVHIISNRGDKPGAHSNRLARCG